MKIIFTLLFVTMLGCGLAQAKVDLVKIDKSEQKLYLIEKGKILKVYHIALGANPKGHKRQEGDSKTPEGSYVLDYKNKTSSYYRSIHISYPNKADKLSAKKRGVSAGGFIMIHGQPNGMGKLSAITQLRNWTDGCIALTNDQMDEFMKMVSVGTKIHIEW